VTTWLDYAGEWLAPLNAAEKLNGIPHNLLARQCYKESGFNPDAKSSAGAVGIMQLEPAFFPHAGQNPVNDIATAAAYLRELHDRFQDWQLSLAAYDWGPGDVHRWLTDNQPFSAMPIETQNYVKQIVADVPVPGMLVATGDANGKSDG
jgi:peptidoglycan DL-endopeptidase CwlO